ncbi:MAG: Fis family transcriptional regulator, partial [Chloroflexi bacterium]
MTSLPDQAASILIVEDEFAIREALTEFLEEEGYLVAGAANGREALAYLQDT